MATSTYWFTGLAAVAVPLGAFGQDSSQAPSAQAGQVPGTVCGELASGVRMLPLASDVLPIIIESPELSNRDAQLARDEFETSAQFQDRVDKFWTDRLGTSLAVAQRSGATATYDADLQALEIRFPYSVKRQPLKPAQVSITVDSQAGSPETYDGTNAYGASREVAVLRSRSLELRFPLDRLPSAFNINSLDMMLYMQMDPEKARAFKERGSFIFIGQFQRPWMERDLNRSDPTFSRPVEVVANTYTFPVEPICFALALDGQVILERSI